MGKNSSGVKVRQRFGSSGFWSARPTIPSIAELSQFTGPRFPEIVVMTDEALLIANRLSIGFPRGSFYRMPVTDPHPYSEKYWHGANLYVVYSLVRDGMRNHKPDNGPPGVYCFSDCRAHKVAGYCCYVLSGIGCAWTAIAELAICPSLTKKFSHDQCVADQSNVTLVAIWFHGITQADFSYEYIFPLWDPSLEVSRLLTLPALRHSALVSL